MNIDGALREVDDSRILVVDDHEANTSLLTHILSRAGLTKVIATNESREVPSLVLEHSPDLVMLDLHMPHLDGFQLLDIITRYAAGQFLPIIVLTADTTEEALVRSLDLGAHDFLIKPLDATQVVLRTRNLLRTRQAYVKLRSRNESMRAELDLAGHVNAVTREPLNLRRARIEGVLAGKGPAMVFQPIFDLTSNTVVGYEALARFSDEPRRGPDVWFSEAASVGLGVDLEVRAARNASELFHLVPDDTFVAINVSPAAILSDLRTHCNPATPWERLVFEMTEHVFVDDYQAIKRAFDPIRALGAKLAVDDAGAGYASLRHIVQLSPDIIKLDISLVSLIDRDVTRQALAIALVAFSESTETMLLAEGIETDAELNVLLRLGVKWGQGYLLGRPSPLPSNQRAETPSKDPRAIS
ncbi:MAG TPA: EAL domain-containing response regulator [Acidimicrobiales bacterium]|nr:EAL domain-containing response regulator [Acidimicrobiales bacterium]